LLEEPSRLSLSLPYSKHRRYLTGIDWTVGALDYSAKKNIGLGGFSQAILDLEGNLSPKTVRAVLDRLSRRFPLVHGRVARDWLNLAPYWRYSHDPGLIALKAFDLPAGQETEAERLLDEHVNYPLDSEWEHLRCIVINIGSDRSRLGLVFDHRLLDAFGAEGVLRLLDLSWQDKLEEVAPLVAQSEPAHLDHWLRRLGSGKTLNRFLHHLSKKTVSALNMPAKGIQRQIHFLHAPLTAEETAEFARRATEEIAVPIILPSAAARAIAAFRSVVQNPPLAGDQTLIFTSATSRLPGQEWEKLFFNQFALIAFTSPNNGVQSVPEIAADIRAQLFDQMKLQIPFVMQDAGALGRICPHRVGNRLLNRLFDGRFCTFYFACIRDCGYPSETFLGQRIVNLYHKPLVFAPPGLNLCMTSYANRFNLVVSYIAEAISHSDAAQFLKNFKSSLLQ
jgi:hypothetical protein